MRENEQRIEKHGRLKKKWSSFDDYAASWHSGSRSHLAFVRSGDQIPPEGPRMLSTKHAVKWILSLCGGSDGGLGEPG